MFEEVNRGHCDYGLVPIENSTDGRIADTLDMFTRLPVQICGEVNFPIHHCLLGMCQRSEVQEVYSKAQPLSQCRNWLSRHLPQARTIEVTSTSTAAQLAKDKPGAAAIASAQAAVHYGLNVLAENIEDQQGNLTRFAVIGQHSGPRTGRDKTAIMFEVAHRPGSLADALGIFKRNRLNLTWIESFPIARPEGGYLFFVEMEGHQDDKRVVNATAASGRPGGAANGAGFLRQGRSGCVNAHAATQSEIARIRQSTFAPLRAAAVEFFITIVSRFQCILSLRLCATLDHWMKKSAMRKKFIAGNWKMNLDRAGAVALAEAVAKRSAEFPQVDIALCPPFVYLEAVRKAIAGTKVGLAGQNLFHEAKGRIHRRNQRRHAAGLRLPVRDSRAQRTARHSA